MTQGSVSTLTPSLARADGAFADCAGSAAIAELTAPASTDFERVKDLMSLQTNLLSCVAIFNMAPDVAWPLYSC